MFFPDVSKHPEVVLPCLLSQLVTDAKVFGDDGNLRRHLQCEEVSPNPHKQLVQIVELVDVCQDATDVLLSALQNTGKARMKS